MNYLDKPLYRLSLSDLETAYYQARRVRIHARSDEDKGSALAREQAIEKEIHIRHGGKGCAKAAQAKPI